MSTVKNALMSDARGMHRQSATYTKQAKNSLKWLKNATKSQRANILECYVKDLILARHYRTQARELYNRAQSIWYFD